MRIGIDIDDTIVNTTDAMCEIVVANNLASIDNAHIWLQDNIVYFLTEYQDLLWEKIKIKKNALYYLNKLKRDGHELVIISARSNNYCSDLMERTKAFLKKMGFSDSNIILDAKEKWKVCLEKKIDLMIDDNETVCKTVKSKGIDILMFESMANLNSNFRKVSSWKQIYNYIVRGEIDG